MAAAQGLRTGEQVVRALDTPDTSKIGAALVQLRGLCSTKPLPAVVLEYIELEPGLDSILNLLNVAREANSIHLLANALYTLSYLLSSSPSSPFATRQALDGSRVINHLIQKHSKSIHRCFAPGRTEATLACLSLLTSCACWNEGACAKIVISELRWDHKTVNRLIQTRQGLTAPNGNTASNPTPASKSSKLKGQLHKADIRTSMLRFLFSVISNTEIRSSVKQELWKTKGLAEGVLKGLHADSYEIVAFVLGNLWDIVTKQNVSNPINHNRNPFVLHSGLDIFDQNTMNMLVQLIDRDDTVKDIHASKLVPTETIAQMVERFLKNFTLYLANSLSTGIFQHQTNSRLPQYRILLNTFKYLSPSKSMPHWRLSLHLLELFPTLCSTFWRTAAPASEPSPTIAWISSVGFATKVASMPLTLPLDAKTRSLTSDQSNINAVPNLAKNMLAQCFPTPLNRIWFTKALQHQNALVSFSSLILLLAGLKKARNFCCQLENAMQSQHFDPPQIPSENWSKLLLAFQQSLQAILPDTQVLIAILQTTSRPANEQKIMATNPSEKSLDESALVAATRPENGGNGDIVTFCVLAVLLLYHEVIPQMMFNLNFDYTKLINTFFKLNSANESQSSSLPALHQLQSPVVHLCQSRTLILIGQSVLTSLIQPSPVLLKVLLLLSSFPKSNNSPNRPSDFAHAPLVIKTIAQETLYTLCKSIAPHLRDEHESRELSIWLDTLSELRTVGEDVTPLVFFLEDCIRACLRHPLKYIQMSQDHRDSKTCIRWDDEVGVPILFSALLSKISAITKGFTTNLDRIISISLIIKFSNIYLLNVLSAAHKARPILMVLYMSTQLNQILGNGLHNQPGNDKCPKYPDYLGDNIIDILRSSSLSSTINSESLATKIGSISWPSYINQSCFSRHTLALEDMYQSFSSAKELKKPKVKKAVAFTPSATNPMGHDQQSIQQQLGYIRFMTRALEMEKLDANIDEIDLKRKARGIKVLVDMVSKSFDDNPILIECFLEEIWDISKFMVERGDIQLLLNILRLSCVGLQQANKKEIHVIIRYADLISDIAPMYLESRDGEVESSSALVQCTCCLLPLVDANYQSKVLVSIISHVDPTVLSDIDYWSIMELLDLASKIESHGKQLLLDRLSTEPVMKVLCALSCAGNGKVATEILLEITERSLADPEAPFNYSDTMLKTWSTYVAGVLESTAKEERDFCTKLKIISCLAQKNRDIASTAMHWLSQAPIDELQLSWDGTLSLLVACFGTLLTKDLNYKNCVLLLGQSRLNELIETIGSCLFSVPSQTSDTVPAKEKATRGLAAKLMNSCATDPAADEILAEQLKQNDRNPAYSEALDVLRTCESRHLAAYVDRCLRWLVRRFAEDENTTDDTEELVKSLDEFLGQQAVDYTLSAYLVNPVLSAALDRCLHSSCVMKLVTSLIRHTQLKEVEILKHVRATVESRNFRSLMRSTYAGQEGQDTLLMSVINQLVISYPAVATQAKLSSTLIAFYGGTVSLKDRLMFQVLRIEDLWSDTPEIEDLMFGWKPISGNRTTTGKNLDFVALLDPAKIEATSVWVLNIYKSEPFPSSPLYYDPSFLLNLLLRMIENEENFSVSTWYSIARVGLLGLAMCALSSDKMDWRFLGDRCLKISHEKLKSLKHKDVSEIVLPIEHFRNLHRPNEETSRIDSVPALITLFFSRCLTVFCATPESSLHPPLTKFLLQRAVIDAKDVPMLYSLLYSSTEIPSESHAWLIQMLHDGLCRTMDWKIMNHRQTFEILITLVLSSSHRNSPKLRLLLLQLIRKAISHNQACIKLISKTGLLKVLKVFKPFSINEWEEVMKILQQVAIRIPLFHYEFSRESIGNIIDILDDLDEDENCRTGQLEITALLIIRSLLVCHSFWRLNNQKIWKKSFSTSENDVIFSKFNQLVQKLTDHQNQSKRHQGLANTGTNKKLVHEIQARILYLNQL